MGGTGSECLPVLWERILGIAIGFATCLLGFKLIFCHFLYAVQPSAGERDAATVGVTKHLSRDFFVLVNPEIIVR